MIEEKMIQQGLKILRDLTKNFYEDSSTKKPLFEDEKENIFLQVTLKKIPECESIKMIKVPLPYSLLKDSDEVCLITGDLDKKNHKAEIEPDILHYQQLLEKHNINCISQVITLRQLRTDYKPYEAKQKLLAAYNVFLTDKKIAECLPRVLGRHFFKKRKFPIQIDMKSPNLKNLVEKALSTKVFHVTGHGNSCCSEVAHLEMEDSQIVENIKVATEVLSKQLPGQLSNINGVYVKTSKSKAIPIYVSYESPNEIQFEELENEASEEESTNSEVLEESGKEATEIKIKKGENDAEVVSDSDLKETVKDTKKSKAKKIKGEPEVSYFESNIEEPVKETKKSKAKKKKNGVQMALSNCDLAELGKETKKSKSKKKRGEAESILSDSDPFSSENKMRKRLLDNFSLQAEAVEKHNSKKKHIKSESSDTDEGENIVESPIQASKKIKIEKIYNTRKNSQKSKKKKENLPSHKF